MDGAAVVIGLKETSAFQELIEEGFLTLDEAKIGFEIEAHGK